MFEVSPVGATAVLQWEWWQAQVLPTEMVLLAEPNPESLLAALEQAVHQVHTVDPFQQHQQVLRSTARCPDNMCSVWLHAASSNCELPEYSYQYALTKPYMLDCMISWQPMLVTEQSPLLLGLLDEECRVE